MQAPKQARSGLFLPLLTSALAAAGLVSTAQGQVQVAGTLLIDVDATVAPLGPITNIVNSGTMGGVFEARYGTNVPTVVVTYGNGARGIQFDGDDFMQHYNGPGGSIVPADPTLTGVNPSCTIEAWVLNPGLVREETIVSWGHRGGGDGSNMSFNYGWDARWGAVGHWGGADMGWDPCCDADLNPTGNPPNGVMHHLVYTYDGVTQRVYSDGALKNSENVGLNTYPNPPVTIAAQMADDVNVEPGLRGTMIISKLRIHSEALTAGGVLSNYLAEVSSVVGNGSPLPTGPVHRYNFSSLGGTATNGTVVVDSAGTAHGAIRGSGAAFTGTRATLPGGASGAAPFIDLPNGLLSSNSVNNGGSGGVTLEGWVKITGNRTWSRVFDFGSSDIGGGVGGEVPGVGGGGAGLDYLFLTAQDGTDVNRHVVDIRNVDPGPGTDPNGPGFDSGNFNRDYHYAVSWNEATGEILVYENGSVIASMSGSGTAMSDIHDVNCWLGRSNWNGDVNTQGEFDEFRIYNRVVPPDQIRQSFVAGPDLVPTTSPVSIVNSPQSLTISELQNAFFTVSLQGSLPVGLQWYKNGSPLGGATNYSLTQSAVLPNQSGSQFYLVASNFAGGVPNLATSSVAILTVLGDTNPPVLTQVRVIGTNQIEAIFSEPIRSADAALTNFALTGPPPTPAITAVAIGSPSNRVVLTLSSPLACTTYTLSVSNIHDQSVSGNVTPPGTSLSFFNFSAPGLTHRYTFNNPPGNATDVSVPDVVSGADGIVRNGSGTTTFTGSRVTLSGGDDVVAPYVDLPNGLLSVNSTNNGGSGQLTFEGWVKNTGTFSWERIFDFGSSDIGGFGGEVTTPGGPNNNGAGLDYFMLSANSGNDTTRRRTELRNEDPGGGGVVNADYTTIGYNRDTHFVVTWDEKTGLIRTYEGGFEVSSTITDDAMSEINDVNCWLGRSNWRGDDNLQGEFDEFRVYNRVLSLADIQLNETGGADNNFGSLLALDLAVTTNSMVTNTIATVRVLASFSGAGTQDLAAAGCVIYSSTDSNVVFITSDGVIHAVNAGMATVSATLGSFTDSEIIDITQDATPPTLLSARANGNTKIEITFSEPVDAGTAEEAGNFVVSTPSGPIGVVIADRSDVNQAKVSLTLDAPMPCEYITVLVSFVADQSPLFNTIPDNSPVGFMNYAPTSLRHRYTFNNESGAAASGAVIPDAIDSADGFVRGTPAAFTGDRVTINGGSSGSAAYIELPPGLLSANAVANGGSGQLTFEGWVKVTGARIWGRIFDFGDSVGGEGKDYFMLSASVGGDVTFRRTELRNEDPAGGGIATVDHATTGFNRNQHFVATWNERTGQIRIYEDGAQKSSMIVDDKMSDINDVNCWLGRSNWTGDENAQGEFDEFRIYNRVLTPYEVSLHDAVGPDNNFGKPLALKVTQANHVQIGSPVHPLALVDFSNQSNADLTISGCIDFSSSNPGVLVPEGNATFKALGLGTATLTTRFSGLTNVMLITVGYQMLFSGLTQGLNYNIQVSPQVTGPWTTIAVLPAAGGGVIFFEDTIPRGPQAFYRAALGPPP